MKEDRRGQSFVEFALTLPALLMILLGIMEVALVVQGYLAVQHAAREAARFAVTNQPPRGACMDLDEDGEFEDVTSNDAQDVALAKARAGNSDGYPYCPHSLDEDDIETEAAHRRRRVRLIKMRARRAAVGLRVDDVYLAVDPSSTPTQMQSEEAGFLGVAVWGFPSFDEECNSYDPFSSSNPCLERPGAEGLPVQVLVKHNVRIIDPLYRAIVKSVPVRAKAQMVNEGVQVGYGDVPPPRFDTDPDPDEPVPPVPSTGYAINLSPSSAINELPDEESHTFTAYVTEDGAAASGELVGFTKTGAGTLSTSSGTTDSNGEVSVEISNDAAGVATITAWVDRDGDGEQDGDEPYAQASKEWQAETSYSIALSPASATNTLPDGRSHELVATVTDAQDRRVEGAQVGFSTDFGAFDYSGSDSDPTDVVQITGQNGQTSVMIYGNYSGTATINAWIDENGDGEQGGDEPATSATKSWTAPGPYVAVSDHEVLPPDFVSVDVMDHNPAENPYRLLWCVISGTASSTVAADPVDVDSGTWDATDISFEVPDSSEGVYRLETHSGSGSCGDDADLVAHSGDIRTRATPPDLTITSLEGPDLVCPRTLFTVTADVENLTTGSVDESFEVDFYVDPLHAPPQRPVGEDKQWLSGIGPGGTASLNSLMWVGSGGEHTIWARVDTADEVAEDVETNNVISWTVPVVGSFEADFNAGAGEFSYSDDEFGGTSEPDYASGERVSSGGYDGGALRVQLGGIDDDDIYGMSGGWQRSFELGVSSDVNLSFRYRMTQHDDYESGEHSQVLVSVDGTLYGAGGEDYVQEISGGGDTDWQLFEVDLGALSAGEHEITIGGYNSRKTQDTEQTNIWFDDVRVTTAECDGPTDKSPWDEIPPGWRECYQVLEAGSFEGEGSTVFQHWDAGEAGAYERRSMDTPDGTFALLLKASLGEKPTCPQLDPYLSQMVQIPQEISATEDVTTTTTMHVRGQYLVGDSESSCSVPESVDADDDLYVQLNGVGDDPSHLITSGAMASLSPLSQSDGGANITPCQPVRKGLLAPVSLAPEPSVNAQSQVIHSASFEGDLDGWTVTDGTAEAGWNCYHDAHDGDCYARGKDWTSEDPDPTLYRTISTVGFENISLSYWRADRDCESGYGGDRFVAEYSTDGGTNWEELQRADPVDWNWTQESFDLPPEADDNPNFMVRFTFDGSYWNDYMAVDDIAVTGALAGPTPTVDFSSSSYTVTEDVGMATITATLSEAANWPVVVQYVSSDETATAGEDYAAVEGVLTFAPGVTEQTFQVPITDDLAYEDDETLLLTLQNEPLSWVEDFSDLSDGATSDTGDTAWSVDTSQTSGGDFSVQDDAFRAINTDGEGIWESEVIDISGAGNVDISVDIWSEDDADDSDYVEVYYKLDGGSEVLIAERHNDFSKETVRVNDLSGDTVQVIVRSDLDHDDESYHWDNVTVSSGGGPAIVGDTNNPAALTIIDNDGTPTVGFSSADYRVDEGVGVAAITATLSSTSYETVTVGYDTADGTATAGDDYTSTVGTLTFPPGTALQTFEVPIIDDEEFSEDDETVNLTLSNPVSATLGNDSATLTIEDNDLPVVDFTASEYNVDEGVGEAVISVTLNLAFTETVSVNYRTESGSAVAPDDYTSVSDELTFDPGDEFLTFTVPIVDDEEYEGNEELTLILSDADNVSIGPNSPASLTINDNEPLAPETWMSFEENFSSDVDVQSLVGQEVELNFYATSDWDEYGTWFYLDALSCEVCKERPVPEPEEGTASIGGSVRVLVEGVPEKRQGIDVWAYSDNGEVYRTVTIQDSTYHFYNIPPGTYTIYAEAWPGGQTAVATVTVGANERDFTISLFLV